MLVSDFFKSFSEEVSFFEDVVVDVSVSVFRFSNPSVFLFDDLAIKSVISCNVRHMSPSNTLILSKIALNRFLN